MAFRPRKKKVRQGKHVRCKRCGGRVHKQVTRCKKCNEKNG